MLRLKNIMNTEVQLSMYCGNDCSGNPFCWLCSKKIVAKACVPPKIFAIKFSMDK